MAKLPLASFGAWSDLVRGTLIWLGRADPVDSLTTVAAEDPMRAQRVAIFQAVANVFGDREFTAKDAVDSGDAALLSAIEGVARGKDGVVDRNRFGQWLRKNKNRIVGPLKLVLGNEVIAGRKQWRVVVVEVKVKVKGSKKGGQMDFEQWLAEEGE